MNNEETNKKKISQSKGFSRFFFFPSLFPVISYRYANTIKQGEELVGGIRKIWGGKKKG